MDAAHLSAGQQRATLRYTLFGCSHFQCGRFMRWSGRLAVFWRPYEPSKAFNASCPVASARLLTRHIPFRLLAKREPPGLAAVPQVRF